MAVHLVLNRFDATDGAFQAGQVVQAIVIIGDVVKLPGCFVRARQGHTCQVTTLQPQGKPGMSLGARVYIYKYLGVAGVINAQ